VKAFDLKSTKDSAIFEICVKNFTTQVHDFNWGHYSTAAFSTPLF